MTATSVAVDVSMMPVNASATTVMPKGAGHSPS